MPGGAVLAISRARGSEELLKTRLALSPCALFLLAVSVGAQSPPSVDHTELPSNYVPSGKTMYVEYCAVCHGPGAKGDGPSSAMLKVPPSDLTTLAKRHDGKFPYEYVSNILRFGPGPTILHGTADMPTWGPIFQYIDKNNQKVVEQRIKNLSDYLASLQVK
jgi:mono/diheme cytochrome c family protein